MPPSSHRVLLSGTGGQRHLHRRSGCGARVFGHQAAGAFGPSSPRSGAGGKPWPALGANRGRRARAPQRAAHPQACEPLDGGDHRVAVTGQERSVHPTPGTEVRELEGGSGTMHLASLPSAATDRRPLPKTHRGLLRRHPAGGTGACPQPTEVRMAYRYWPPGRTSPCHPRCDQSRPASRSSQRANHAARTTVRNTSPVVTETPRWTPPPAVRPRRGRPERPLTTPCPAGPAPRARRGSRAGSRPRQW